MTGVWTLIRFLLRRDRIKLPAWIAGLVLFVVYVGSAVPQVAPTDQDLAALSVLFTEPVGRMFTGPAFGMDAPTLDRFFAAGYVLYLFIIAALMNIMLVVRHTRAEEQTGRAELVRANAVGRHAPLTAALMVALIANAVAAGAVALTAIGVGFAAPGSMLIGAATGATGLAFAGITAVTVQLSAYSRTAAGLAGFVLGVAFVCRALGDMAATGGTALSWISPLGWASQTAPFTHDRWWPLGLTILLALGTTVAAYVLQERRDFGASLFAVRPGPARAPAWLGTPVGLAWRLQRPGFWAWGAGILALGVVDGAFAQALLDAGDDMPAALRDMFGDEQLLNGYVAFLGSFVGVLVAAYAIFALHTLNTEESRGRTDAVLAAPVSRTTWILAHGLVVAVAAAVMTLATGVATGVATAMVTDRWGLVADVTAAHAVQLPAIVFMVALGVALHAWWPRLFSLIAWLVVGVSAVVTFFADLLGLPDWVTVLSPFEYVPSFEAMEWLPVLALVGLAALVMALGAVGYRQRQINTV